jgi:diacylglycerol kinase family enzyme
VTVFLNQGSGRTAATSNDAIAAAFAAGGITATIVRLRGAEIRREAERVAAAGHTLVAGGGDGTVSTVASVAARTGAAFGVLPLGTLNHFAKDAGIPMALEEAAAIIAAGHTRRFDVGVTNDRIFVNNASLGLYPRLVWEREQEMRRGRGKWTAFAIALLRTWRRYRKVTVRMTLDGVSLVRRTPFVFVGNGQYQAEGLGLGRRTSIGDHLSVYLAPEAGPIEIAGLPLRALVRRLKDVQFEMFSACDVAIETARRPVRMAFDGELAILDPPLRCTIRLGALRTLVPEDGC